MFRRKLKLRHIIPKEFSAIFHLLAAPEPDPITVPSPYPTVDWSTVRFKPALPNPEQFPVLSVSKDPTVYQMKPTGWSTNKEYSIFTESNPFGTLPGYQSNQGVVAVPSTPVMGYLYSSTFNKWVLAASTTRGPEGIRSTSTSGREGRRGKLPRSHR